MVGGITRSDVSGLVPDHPEDIVKLDLHCLVGPSLFEKDVLSLAIQ